MNLSRRRVLMGLTAGALIPTRVMAADREAPTAPWQALIGTWNTTSAQTSLILSLEPQREAVFILVEKGSHGIGRTRWRIAPGGVLVSGIPRVRLWPGRHPGEARAEIEELPGLEVSEGLATFPRTFFMSRIAPVQTPRELETRPLPEHWEKPLPPTDWDEHAGRRRPLPGASQPPGGQRR